MTVENDEVTAIGTPDDQPVPRICNGNSNTKVEDGQSVVRTPMLGTLPPLGRAQYLQVVLRPIKGTNGDDA